MRVLSVGSGRGMDEHRGSFDRKCGAISLKRWANIIKDIKFEGDL